MMLFLLSRLQGETDHDSQDGQQSEIELATKGSLSRRVDDAGSLFYDDCVIALGIVGALLVARSRVLGDGVVFRA